MPRQRGGVVTLLDLRQAEQLVDTAAETIPGIQQQIEQTENQVNLLLGRNPGEVPRRRNFGAEFLPPQVPAGIPSSLLERRPDILAAEQNLVAANAEIGAAKAAYFPQLSLSGFLGGQSSQLSSLFNGPKRAWSFVPEVSQPIFTAGRLKSNVRITEAKKERALVQYEKTIQTAFTEVSNALMAHQRVRESREKQEALVAALVCGLVAIASATGDDGRMPDFDGATGWLNSAPLSTKSLRGKVVLVNFWTYSCINSLRELPYIKA